MFSALVEQFENCKSFTPSYDQLKTIFIDILDLDRKLDPTRKFCYLDAVYPMDFIDRIDPKRSLFVIPPWCSPKFDIKRLHVSNSGLTWSYLYDFFKFDRKVGMTRKCFVEVSFFAPIKLEPSDKHTWFEFDSLKVYNADHIPINKKGESLIFSDKKCRERLHFVSVRYATPKELEKHEDWIYSTSHISSNDSDYRLPFVPEKNPKNACTDVVKKTRSERKNKGKQKEPEQATAHESKTKKERTQPRSKLEDVYSIITDINAKAQAYVSYMESKRLESLRLVNKASAEKADAEAIDVSSVFDDTF